MKCFYNVLCWPLVALGHTVNVKKQNNTVSHFRLPKAGIYSSVLV